MGKPSALLLPTGLVLAVVLISGCTGLTNLFGGDVINVQQTVIQNGVQDVIVVKDVQTIPKSPLLPDQQLLLSFIVENKDKLQDVKNVRIDLFNAPTIRNSGGTLCNLYVASSYTPCTITVGTCLPQETLPGVQTPSQQRYCIPDQCGAEGCAILPGEEKPITFALKTPTQDDIKNIKTDTKLDFKATYEFNTSLNYIVPAISTDEIVKRQRSGDKANLFTTKSYGSGPVQIDVELQGAPYILSGSSPISTSQPETVMFFTIKNRGSGTLVNSQIDNGNMTILFPPELDVTPNEKFSCNSAPNTGGMLCTNNKRSADGKEDLGVIPLYRDQSRSSLRFTVKLRQSLNEPFRSFPITATVDYTYELRDSVSMTINPFQNV